MFWFDEHLVIIICSQAALRMKVRLSWTCAEGTPKQDQFEVNNFPEAMYN